MKKKKKPIVIDAVFDPVGKPVESVVKADDDREILTGVVLKRCPVVSFNPWSNVLVYERDGKLIQTNAIEYHGEGYVEVE